MRKNIYVLMDENGRVSYDTLCLIRRSISIETAKKHVAKALAHARTKIDDNTIYVMVYGNITCYVVPAWSESALSKYWDTIKFENQAIHDLAPKMKIEALTDFEYVTE